MACNHTDHYNQSYNIELVHDTENRSFKSIEPPIHQVAGEQTKTQQQQDQTQTLNTRKKCHGNRKLQHFKRKCRARGLSEEQITTVIHQNNRTISEQSPNDPTIFEQPHPSSKQKRNELATDNSLNTSMKSKSQLSLAAAKKLKHSTKWATFTNDDVSNQASLPNFIAYKPSKYLKMPRRLLLHSLYLQLNYRSKKKKEEQTFVLSRLTIIDQQFCLEQIRSLYQTYFDLGSQHHIWPVSYHIVCSTLMCLTDLFRG